MARESADQKKDDNEDKKSAPITKHDLTKDFQTLQIEFKHKDKSKPKSQRDRSQS